MTGNTSKAPFLGRLRELPWQIKVVLGLLLAFMVSILVDVLLVGVGHWRPPGGIESMTGGLRIRALQFIWVVLTCWGLIYRQSWAKSSGVILFGLRLFASFSSILLGLMKKSADRASIRIRIGIVPALVLSGITGGALILLLTSKEKILKQAQLDRERAIDESLDRIKAETAGRCEKCHGNISPEEIQQNSTPRLCAQCQMSERSH